MGYEYSYNLANSRENWAQKLVYNRCREARSLAMRDNG